MPDLIVPKNKNKSKNYFASQNTPYIPSPEGRGFTAFFGNLASYVEPIALCDLAQPFIVCTDPAMAIAPVA